MSATYFCERPCDKNRKRLNGWRAGQYGKEKKVPMTYEDGHVYMIDRKTTVRAKQYLLKKSKHSYKKNGC